MALTRPQPQPEPDPTGASEFTKAVDAVSDAPEQIAALSRRRPLGGVSQAQGLETTIRQRWCRVLCPRYG